MSCVTGSLSASVLANSAFTIAKQGVYSALTLGSEGVRSVANTALSYFKKEPLLGTLLGVSLICTASTFGDIANQAADLNTACKFGAGIVSYWAALDSKITKERLITAQNESKTLCLQNHSRNVVRDDQPTEHRYNDTYIKTLIDLAGPNENDAREIAFVVLPANDHNQAFSLKLDENSSNWSRLAKKFKIEWVRAAKPSDITEAMQKVNQTISHLWIQAHGNQKEIALSNQCQDCLNQDELTTDIFPNLSPTAHILLTSCSTGAPGGIAETFSTLFPEATIQAPMNDTTNTTLYFRNNKPELLELTEDGEACIRTINKKSRS